MRVESGCTAGRRVRGGRRGGGDRRGRPELAAAAAAASELQSATAGCVINLIPAMRCITIEIVRNSLTVSLGQSCACTNDNCIYHLKRDRCLPPSCRLHSIKTQLDLRCETPALSLWHAQAFANELHAPPICLCAVFQQLELDYTIAPTHPVAHLDLKEAPVIRMCATSPFTYQL